MTYCEIEIYLRQLADMRLMNIDRTYSEEACYYRIVFWKQNQREIYTKVLTDLRNHVEEIEENDELFTKTTKLYRLVFTKRPIDEEDTRIFRKHMIYHKIFIEGTTDFE